MKITRLLNLKEHRGRVVLNQVVIMLALIIVNVKAAIVHVNFAGGILMGRQIQYEIDRDANRLRVEIDMAYLSEQLVSLFINELRAGNILKEDKVKMLKNLAKLWDH